jgi:enoyl-CoA hydratase
MNQSILYTIKNQTAVVTLNRPEKRNAINQNLITGLYNAIDSAAQDEKICAIIITGNGKSFCAGIDLAALATDNLFDPRGDGRDMVTVFGDCSKPIIGAVNGHAITGGFELALNCDFLIASQRACFADTHAKMNIHPGWGMTQLLQQAVGQRMAKQLSLTCEFIQADHALKIGLVNEVVPEEKLLDRAIEIAQSIASVNQQMMATVKKRIEYRNTTSFEKAMAAEQKGFRSFVDLVLQAK